MLSLVAFRQCTLRSKHYGFAGVRCLANGSVLLKSNTPRFDEAELLSSNLTSKRYAAKKPSKDYEWPDRSAEEMEKEYRDRYEKFMKLTAALQGLLVVAGVGIAATVYSKWPQIKGWWLTKDRRVDDDTLEKLVKKKAQKWAADIPVVPSSEPGFDVPGLYYWGELENPGNKSSQSMCFPKRNCLFDGRYLRDVCLSKANGIQRHLAIDDEGNLLEWNSKDLNCILPGQDLLSVKVSNSCAYALNKRGEILIIPLESDDDRLRHISQRRSWLMPWKSYTVYDFKLRTNEVFKDRGEKKIASFDTGREHLVLISNTGKAYSCATGTKQSDNTRSRGQFGLPTLSHFDEFPPTNKLYEIELLNNELSDDKKVQKRKIEQVACGDYHTLARDSNGGLFVFGLNQYGQLGLPILYDIEQVPYPKILKRFNCYFTRDADVKCTDIRCCDETSFVTMAAKGTGDISYFAFGNGQYGELGNGNFKNSQSEPTPIKAIDAKIEEWSCGRSHVLCKLEGGDVVAWGSNDHGQLGTGKRIKQGKPVRIPDVIKPGLKTTQEEICRTKLRLAPQQHLATGEDFSCIYWRR
ncbi:hypothetical protein HG536_0B06960 [Torulaspora globosa]|uniref:Uncharacterized protein n=1 Tax=Torulaspora globosa TaxID=48254 RepID=A0A7G3ZE92_9SACH|nr:uncharacterized protein HG536_0B06960 [Torulaspora globosa]QLL31828.1 hypothetical protein HG536_0B06960 [Torulaspora globosa]